MPMNELEKIDRQLRVLSAAARKAETQGHYADVEALERQIDELLDKRKHAGSGI